MASKKTTFEELLEKSLLNAQEDRENALEAYGYMKGIYTSVDSENAESLQSVMLIGQNAVKLLEQCSRSNEQIIKLAQLKEKESRGKPEDDDENFKWTIDDVKKLAANNGE